MRPGHNNNNLAHRVIVIGFIAAAISVCFFVQKVHFSQAQTAAVWTDDPIPAGQAIRATWMQELRAEIDARRMGCAPASACWLGAYPYTNNNIAAGDVIKLNHINDLRAAIVEQYVLYGDAPPVTISDGVNAPTNLAAGSLIRPNHFSDMRTGIDNVKYCGDGNCDAPEVFGICGDCASICDNDIVEGAEQCDDTDGDFTDLGGQTCATLFPGAGGQLRCHNDLTDPFDGGTAGNCTFDTNNCVFCDDDIINGVEQCDDSDGNGVDLGVNTCTTLDPTKCGVLACNNFTTPGDCTFDISGCVDICNNDLICDDPPGVDCDETPANCPGDCGFCGNDIIEGIEVCDDSDSDGVDLGGEDCVTQTGDPSAVGTLACDNSDCLSFDVTACIWCGNDVVEGAEQCDDTDGDFNDLGGNACEDAGAFRAGVGQLRCNNDATGANIPFDCTFDTSGCVPVCNNDGTCDCPEGENNTNCPADCGTCAGALWTTGGGCGDANLPAGQSACTTYTGGCPGVCGGTVSADCDATGNWINQNDNCAPGFADCDIPPNPPYTNGAGANQCTISVSSIHGQTGVAGACAEEGACTAECDDGSMINWNNTCNPFDCTSPPAVPGNTTLCAGDNTSLPADTPISVSGNGAGSCTATKCEYYCNAGFSKSGDLCLANCNAPPYTNGAGATQCTINVSSTHGQLNVAGSCANSGTCDADCNNGVMGNWTMACSAFTCTSPPAAPNATEGTLCPGAGTSLLADTPNSVSGDGAGSCTGAKCEYYCNASYTKSGNSCVFAICASGTVNQGACSPGQCEDNLLSCGNNECLTGLTCPGNWYNTTSDGGDNCGSVLLPNNSPGPVTYNLGCPWPCNGVVTIDCTAGAWDFAGASDSCTQPTVTCGDGFCHPGEDGSTCPQDCCDGNVPCGFTLGSNYCLDPFGWGYDWYDPTDLGLYNCAPGSGMHLEGFMCGDLTGSGVACFCDEGTAMPTCAMTIGPSFVPGWYHGDCTPCDDFPY